MAKPIDKNHYATPENEEAPKLLFKDLIKFDELQKMLEVSYSATGMPSGIIDAITGEVYADAGWQKICTDFHRVHPETNAKCIASDTAITDKIKHGQYFANKCRNGLWDIGVPVHCMGTHIATFFLGQFFYINEEPDISFFINQAERLGFDKEKYLEALAEIPRFTREQVQQTLKYNTALADFLSELASSSMKYKQEISQRKIAEKELRNLQNYLSNIIDSMPSALIGVNLDGIITQWNKGAEQVSSLASKQAVGQPLEKVLPRLSSEMDKIKLAIATRQKKLESAKPCIINNETKYEDLTIYPLVENGVSGAVIRIDDVTDRINLEKMMIQSEKMMSIGGLAAGMAHEINNPLAGIIGYAYNIKNRLFGDLEKNSDTAQKCNISLPNLQEYLTRREIPRMVDGIINAGHRASLIISNVLNFSRKSESNFTEHSLIDLLDNTLELIENDYNLNKKYDFKKIEIIKDYDRNIPAIKCEGNEIQQVLLNILKNGAESMSGKEYSDDKPRFICRISQQNEIAIIEIEDSGTGIGEQDRKRIFEPFYTTKEIGKGTGLGLSISYFIIVNQHNGSLEVQSKPGSWTKFTIKLPFADRT
ncbi:PocR ligand-binding domain-containing protein [Desulfovibrio gilichinskyi]|uniref:histidine kinase n=1 Tax=Desulfovibrio gilichinskyi TaxID=1519643 RepID=A0A1X7C9F0_9BACT|nr:PocR ligand-binding domain-containing protein [Desulfovibrio gilichinskyi]SME92480.1 PAS domain S-box-containing protein [Desulfovibrio gilichinskyi]